MKIPNRALASISEYRSLSRAHHKELTGLRGNYSDLLDKELASAVKAGIVRQDIPVAVLRLALLNYLNWTPRWYQLSGPLPLDELAGIYGRVFFDGIAAPRRARPSVPQLQNPRRTRAGPAHSGTLGKFVRTAAELFSKQGYASTSTRSISKFIGMEKATLYYHVKSKEDLLYLITKSSIETLQRDVDKALNGTTCPFEQLIMLIQAHCMSLLRDQTQHATALAEVRALSPERLAEIASMRKSYQEGIRQIIEAAQKSGCIRAMWNRAISPRCSRACWIGWLSGIRKVARLDRQSLPAISAISICSERTLSPSTKSDVPLQGVRRLYRGSKPKMWLYLNAWYLRVVWRRKCERHFLFRCSSSNLLAAD